jgi:hypothetical protein
MQERNKMKIYRLDESVSKPDWWREEDNLNGSNPKKKIWVEEAVMIFGQIVYTEKYKLISRKEWKRRNKHRQHKNRY